MIFGAESKILVFDGAVGTEFYERGFYINRPFEELNLSAAADVAAVHRAYIDAGADVITTNTFSITVPQLAKFDLESKQAELLNAALRIAAESVRGTQVKVGLSVGPTGELIEPLGPTSRLEIRTEFEKIAKLALASGHRFDLYILETFTDLDELENAIEGLRSADTKTPILASFSPASADASAVAEFARRIGTRADVEALGLNCSEGPSFILKALQELVPVTTKPIVVQPNSGLPQQINGRYFYLTSPDYLAKHAKRFVEAGASGVGGCCGTGPAHVRAIAAAVRMMNAKRVTNKIESTGLRPDSKEALTADKRPWSERGASRVGQILRSGRKVISVELTSPRGTDLSGFTRALEDLERAGIQFVNVPDGPRASTRVSSLHLASAINRDPARSITVLPHFTARDRNLIALQADLLGASINGVTDLLLVTGDPPKLGNNKEATAVYDIDSIGLTHLVNCLNAGTDPRGEKLTQGTEFGIGVASNPTAINLELERQRWKYKCEMGADFAVTQPIFEAESFLRWIDLIGANSRPHVVSIWPLVSLRNAEFMANEVPGVKVPAWVLEEMAKAGDDKSEAVKRGLAIARRVMRELKDVCQGFCVSAPLGRYAIALEALKDPE